MRTCMDETTKGAPCCTNGMNVETNATSSFANHGAVLQGVVDSFNGVVLHADQEARAELRMGGTRVEEGRGRVGEVTLGHQVVCLNDAVEISSVDTNSDTHDHLLRALGYSSIDPEEIRAFECLETETEMTFNNLKCRRERGYALVVIEVTVIDDGGIEGFGVVADDLVGFLRYHA